MAWVSELLRAIDLFDPEFRQGIIPAEPADVRELRDVLGLCLPADYSEFLEVMGAYDGGLLWAERVSTNPRDLIAYCQRQIPLGGALNDPRCVPFGVGADFDGFGLRLDPGAAHPPVVLLQGMLPGEEVCQSLPALLWSHAFLFEQAATGWVVVSESLESLFTVDKLEAMVADVGYDRCWFSRPSKRFFRKDDRLLTLHESKSGTLSAYIGSSERGVIVDAVSELKRSIGNFRDKWMSETTLPEIRRRHFASGNGEV